jgi:hypothetical protein
MAHLVFIHGIANKPEPDELLGIWRRVLGRADGDDPGVNLGSKGINSSLIYWADVMYGLPDPDASRHESVDQDAPEGLPTEIETEWNEDFDGAAEEEWARSFEASYGIDLQEQGMTEQEQVPGGALERIPLPWVIKRPFMKLLARDTHHYLFNKEFSPRDGTRYKVRDEIRSRFVKALENASEDGGPLVVVAHSQGTIVTYDCLKNVAGCPKIDALITVGSPLGLDEVQDKLAPGYSRNDGFPSEALKGAWNNVYDPLDIVSRPDPKLANDFLKGGRSLVQDHVQTNRGLWRHSMTEYLSGAPFRNIVRTVFDLPDSNA